MKRLLLLALMMVVLAACAELPPGDYALIPLDGQPIQGESFEYDGPSGHYRVSVWEWLETPALDTPALLPTYTPYPTLTPWPTYTPYPTYTPVGVIPTPTPDSEITPAPTIERFCEAQVQGSFHQVRVERSTSAQAVGSMAPSTWMRVEQIVRNAQGEWLYGTGENANGAALTGWALVTPNLVLQDSQACWAVPYEDEVDPLPTIAPTATPQTVTPVPTEPQPDDCTYSHVFAMTMRDGPGTSYPRIGTLPANTRVIVGHIYPDTAAERWAFITHEGATGWVAVRAGGIEYGRLEGDCSKVPRTQPMALRAGPHVLVGAQGTLADYADRFGTYKCLTHSESICLAARSRNPNLTLVYRSLHVSDGMRDCPNYNEWLNPDEWWRKLKPYLPAGFDYYEVINECWPPTMQTMVTFSIRIAELAAGEGKAILAFSFFPGAPEIADWDVLYDYLAWADANPLPDGRHHGVALHAAGYAPPEQVPAGSWVNDVWVAGRHTLVNARLLQTKGYSLKQFRGPIYITELGWDDGYQSTSMGSLGWGCAQYAAAVARTKAVLSEQGIIDGLHIWNFGSGGTTKWVDLSPCAAQIAQRLNG